MPYRTSHNARPAMYNTPAIRTGGFGALQLEAITNRPLSIARRHLAASQLRMRDIEPDELSHSEWVQFLVMEEHQRDRWMTGFLGRRRRQSEGSTSSREDDHNSSDKENEARAEARGYAQPQSEGASSSSAVPSLPASDIHPASLWVRQYEARGEAAASSLLTEPQVHARRTVRTGTTEAPPTYESSVRPRTPPPAYEPRSGSP